MLPSIQVLRQASHSGHKASGSYSTGAILVIKSSRRCSHKWPVRKSMVPFKTFKIMGSASSWSGRMGIPGSDLASSRDAVIRRASSHLSK